MALIKENFQGDELNIFTGGIYKVINDFYPKYPKIYPEVFYEEKTSQGEMHNKFYNGLEYMEETHDNVESVTEDAFQEIGRVIVKPRTYSRQLVLGMDAVADDLAGVLRDVKKASTKIVKSDIDTKEYHAAQIFNNAASTTGGYDGVALASASHTATTGGNQSNYAATDLDESALNTAIIAMWNRKNDKNLPIRLTPEILYVSPTLFPTAWKIVNSMQVAGGSLNDKNWVNDVMNIKVIANPWLTDTDAWYLIAKENKMDGDGLVFYNREPLQTKIVTEESKRRHVVLYWSRYLFTWLDWRYVQVSVGA